MDGHARRRTPQHHGEDEHEQRLRRRPARRPTLRRPRRLHEERREQPDLQEAGKRLSTSTIEFALLGTAWLRPDRAVWLRTAAESILDHRFEKVSVACMIRSCSA